MKDFELGRPENGSRWVEVAGYKFRYQVSEEGRVRKEMPDGSWFYLKQYTSGRARACVKMRTAEDKKVDVPVVWLVADAFLGGRRNGMAIVHRNGAKFDCSARNLKFVSRKECGLISAGNRRRPVLKLDRKGEVVAIYPSVRKAADENFISQSSIWLRCAGKVQDPYRLDGYNYQYESARRGTK